MRLLPFRLTVSTTLRSPKEVGAPESHAWLAKQGQENPQSPDRGLAVKLSSLALPYSYDRLAVSRGDPAHRLNASVCLKLPPSSHYESRRVSAALICPSVFLVFWISMPTWHSFGVLLRLYLGMGQRR